MEKIVVCGVCSSELGLEKRPCPNCGEPQDRIMVAVLGPLVLEKLSRILGNPWAPLD